MSFQPINPWAKGDALAASHLNEPLGTVRSVQTITGQHPIKVSQTPAGTTISIDETPTPASSTLKFGRAVEDWGGNNYIGVVPTDINGDDTGEPEINIDLTSPNNGTAPTGATIAEGDIIAYIEYPEEVNEISGIAVAAKIGSSNTVPNPTAKYQVLSCTAYTNSTTFTIDFDWVRCKG